MKNIKANRYILPAAYYWIHPGRPILTRPKDCWLRRKESSHASQNKQTNKPTAPTLPCQAQLSLIHVKSLQICWATPTPSIHRMLILGVSKKTYWCPGYNATVLDADSRVWIFMMHGRIQKILSGGVGCPENSILVFSQRAVRTWPAFQSSWTQGVLLLLEVVNNSISKETYNNL